MENPYAGRATLNPAFDGMEIAIPARRYWFVIVFLGFWLCCWLLGEIMVAGMLFAGKVHAAIGIFMFAWLGAWTAGGFFAFSVFWWMLQGKEVITLGQGRLTVEKRGLLFYKPKTYDLNEVKKVRVSPNEFAGWYGLRGAHYLGYFNTGIIRFDYGLKTVNIAGGIDEAEARYILEQLRSRRLLSDKNF